MTKNWLILLFFNFVFFISNAQNKNSVQEIVKKYPKFNLPEKIAERINLDFKTDYLKAKAVYYWLALNINYKTDKSNKIKMPEYIVYFSEYDLKRRRKILNTKLVKETLESKTAVCNGYALSFKEICNLLKIKNDIIKGYVKDTPDKIGHFPKYKNHIWNAIKINKKWLFVDVTFGSNRVYKNNKWNNYVNLLYFDISKEKLVNTHYPEKEKWLTLMNQKPLLDFSLEPIYYDEYLASNIELLTPKNGIIQPESKAKKIILKFKNLKDINIDYSYGWSNIGLQPHVYFKDDKSAIVSIKKPNKSDILNIFFNNKLAIQYKVTLE